MCGFVVTASSSPTPSAADHHNKVPENVMLHRGPDDYQIYNYTSQNISVNFHFWRLHITGDIGLGSQPLVSERYIMVFNGEIYDFNSSVSATGLSDSELLFDAIHQRGLSALKNLCGFFSIVVLDKATDTLFWLRDQPGIKPSFYSLTDTTLTIASEPNKAIFDNCSTLCHEALHSFNNFNTPLHNWFLKGLSISQPGTLYSLVPEQQLFQLSVNEDFYTYPTTLSTRSFTETFLSAIKKNSAYNGDIALLFSGGLDSTALLLGCRELGFYPKLFCLRRSRLDPDYTAATQIARHLNLPITTIAIHSYELLPASLLKLHGPFSGSSYYSALALYNAISSHGLRVALSGDGSDELFYGYKWSSQSISLNEYIRASSNLPGYSNPTVTSPHVSIDSRDYDLKYYLNWNLLRTDFCSMYYSVEARVPFLDQELINWSLLQEPSTIMSKKPVKDFVHTQLGASLYNKFFSRPKKGFSFPLSNLGITDKRSHIVSSILSYQND